MSRHHILGSALLLVFAAACGEKKNDAKPEPKSSVSAERGPVAPSVYGEPALKQLDIGKLSERERSELRAQLDEMVAPCPETPVPLSQCIAEKRGCPTCKPAGDMLGRLIRAGAPRADRSKIIEGRFDPKILQTIDTKGCPSKGPADAPVTIVEWADFECPHCAMMGVLLELLMERFPGQIRVVYKFYALPAHPHALEAAYACMAAQNQGKFWELNKIFFANQDKLEKADLVRYAREEGLDVEQFKKDFEDEKTRAHVKADMKAADDLGLDGTPLMYVNGRKLPLEGLSPFYEEFEAWLKLDIELAGKKPAEPTAKFHVMLKEMGGPAEGPEPAPSGSASAGAAPLSPPSASASASPSVAAPPSSASATAAPKK